MTELRVEADDRSSILVHYYRAMVGRADIWRTRMDTTTNWAIGSTAAVISFAFGNSSTPHYVVCIAPLMTTSFLLLEARRLTFYHLWQQQVLLLEQGLIRPALAQSCADESALEEAPAPELEGDIALALSRSLGRTVPSMSLGKAIARRLRRIYLYLFAVQLLAWVFKLMSHPAPAHSLREFLERAHVGVVSGGVVVALALVLFLSALALALGLGRVERTSP